MTTPPSISRFTPSLMEHALLERLFVAREGVLDDIVRRIKDAATTDGRNHTLLVGPRGSGKTHLVTLAYHRTRHLITAGARLQVSWLPEDPWTLISYRHLLAAVVDKLEPAAEDPPKDVDALEQLVAMRAREHGPIVVFVENLDQILDNLGDVGQQRLRHLLQAERSLILVASTTRLDRSLSDQASPFYGFFTTTQLRPFVVAEASAMLTQIAREKGDDDLIDYLATEEGQARLRAVTHLAGGQPRMWATLASALTVDGLDELVDLLLTRFDDLTPYYQEQLGRLAPQQRLVVAELAGADRPLHVKDLAERVGLDQRSIGKTMVDLVDRGWAAPTTSPIVARLDQRKTFYELAEPMARLAFQIKESRGEPLRIIVEFLKLWFDPVEVRSMAARTRSSSYFRTAYFDRDDVSSVARRIQGLSAFRADADRLLWSIDESLAELDRRDPSRLLTLPSPVRQLIEQEVATRGRSGARCLVHRMALDDFDYEPRDEMRRWLEASMDITATSSGMAERSEALLVQAQWLARMRRFEESLAAVEQAEEHLGSSDREILVVKSNVTIGRAAAGDELGSMSMLESVLQPLSPDQRRSRVGLTLRSNLAHLILRSGDHVSGTSLLGDIAEDARHEFGNLSSDALVAEAELAAAYLHAGQVPAATKVLEGLVPRQLQVLGPFSSEVLQAAADLARADYERGHPESARAILSALDAALETLHDGHHSGADHSWEHFELVLGRRLAAA